MPVLFWAISTCHCQYPIVDVELKSTGVLLSSERVSGGNSVIIVSSYKQYWFIVIPVFVWQILYVKYSQYFVIGSVFK